MTLIRVLNTSPNITRQQLADIMLQMDQDRRLAQRSNNPARVAELEKELGKMEKFL